MLCYCCRNSRRPKKLEQIVADAKKEGEVTLVASASTFGGKKGFAELEALFAKRYGFKGKVNLSGGAELSTDGGSYHNRAKGRHEVVHRFVSWLGWHLHDHASRKGVTKSATGRVSFPGSPKRWKSFRQESVFVYASFHGIIYNSNAIPKDKAPKSYEDLIDPALSPTWAGKMAMPAYIHWLIRVSPIWGKEKDVSPSRVSSRRLPAAGCVRAKRSASSAASFRSWRAPAALSRRCGSGRRKGAPLVGLPGSSPASSSYYQSAVPKNSAHPNMAKLFVAFMTTREAQSVLEKHGLSQLPFGRRNLDGEICQGQQTSRCKIPRN